MSLYATGEILAFFNLGGYDMLILAVVALVLFGGRLPETGRALGKGLREFRKGLKGMEEEMAENDKPKSTTTTETPTITPPEEKPKA